MHWYKRNLGDYAKKAGRLTMLQHGAYTLLIDSCYDREQFPSLEEAIEWTWASTEAEIEAVKFVLSRFFKRDEGGKYVQERILAELLDYHSKADKNKQIAIDRESKRRQTSTNRARVVNEAPPNQEPITKNQEPITKNQEPITSNQPLEKGGKSERGTRLPKDWKLPQDLEAWAKEERPGLDIAKTADCFRDYWASAAGQKGVKLDWGATWRNWVRNQRGGQSSTKPTMGVSHGRHSVEEPA